MEHTEFIASLRQHVICKYLGVSVSDWLWVLDPCRGALVNVKLH